MNKLKKLLNKWREKYKLTYVHANTFNVKWSIKLSFINFLTLVLFFIFIISLSTYFILLYTPLKKFVFDDVSIYKLNTQFEANQNALLAAEKKLSQQEKYTNNLKNILTEKPFNDTLMHRRIDTLEGVLKIDFEKSTADSILRKKMETEVTESKKNNQTLQAEFFMNPVSGVVSKGLIIEEKHYGVDIATEKDETIKVILEGRVIFSGWNSQSGYTIIVQHKNNMISSYKHCATLLKLEGEFVEMGDPIGIVGNTGELTSGPHLHFEVWQNGIALNPQEFISF
ncbi:MAG: M23 family metallopeptidase [Crocinitomicaceae bacterium]